MSEKIIVPGQTSNIGSTGTGSLQSTLDSVPVDPGADGSGTSGHPNAPAYRINLETKVPGILLNNLAWTQSGFIPNTFWKLADGSGNINNGDPYNGLHVVPFGTTGADLPDESNDAGKWINKLTFDRQGASTSGLEFSININIYYDSQEDPTLADNVQYQFVHKFFNSTSTTFFNGSGSYDTTNSWGLAEYVLNLIKGDGVFEDINTGANRAVSEWLNVTTSNGGSNINTSKDTTDDSTGGGTPTNPHYFHTTTNNANRFRKFSASINVSGEVFMKKFDQKPAYENNAMDIITKDIDFGFPGVRKKIHKVIVTYKAPYAQFVDLEVGSEEYKFYAYSNVKPTYALNGQMKLRNVNNYDWKSFNVFNLPSNATIDQTSMGQIVPGSTNPVWIRQELLPYDGMAAWNNIYSIALRFSNIGPVKGFEINDISIIYRVKNLK